MPPQTVSHKNYENHYRNQRERIMEAAEKLFIQKGIHNVSITAIAKAARMARITLYEYFPNKEEIAWAIFQYLFEETLIDKQLMRQEGNGFQRIERFMLQIAQGLESNPEHARFIVEFNSLYAREEKASRLVQIFEEGKFNKLLTQMVRDGVQDGSIRPDLNPDLTAAAIGNLVSAVSARFSLLGDHISEEYSLPWMSICLEIIRTFLRGLQLP